MKRSMSLVSKLPHERPGPFRRFTPGYLKPSRERFTNRKPHADGPPMGGHVLVVARSNWLSKDFPCLSILSLPDAWSASMGRRRPLR